MIDGVLVVDKAEGPTSHDVVSRARRALGERRIGHTGTLDPAATGVLPLVVGRATRLARFLSATDKEYEAVVRFGLTTDSYDRAGAVTTASGRVPTRAALEEAIVRFRGTLEQVPPAYSAKKIDGERAYARARRAEDVRPAAVTVSVYALELLSLDDALARLTVRCSAGFYVRSLAHDLGAAVGTGACLEALRRVCAGPFGLADAVAYDALRPDRREWLATHIKGLKTLLPEIPAVVLTEDDVRRARHGQNISPDGIPETAAGASAPTVRLLSPAGELIGLAEPVPGGGCLHPTVVLS